ncbi:MAG: PadR family transcriptional regulator [Thermoplasmata archaeon]
MKRERILGGVMTLLVLRKLLDGPSYGYALEQYLNQKLGTPTPAGTIYAMLRTLKRRRFISVKERVRLHGRDVTNYELTEQGREFLRKHRVPLLTVRRVIDELVRALE